MKRANAPTAHPSAIQPAQALAMAAVTVALNAALPILRETPHWIGSRRAKNLWKVHLHILCRSNPKASFCLVSSASTTVQLDIDPSALANKNPSQMDLHVVPMRFHPDGRANLHLRPSCNAELACTLQQWLTQADSLETLPPQQIDGLNVTRFCRRSDGMELLVANSESAAEVITGELIRSAPLWRNLAASQPSLRQTLMDRIA